MQGFEEFELANDDRENVASRQDEELVRAELDLGAAVLAVQDTVADGDVERNAVAVVVDAAGAYSYNFALLGLFLRGVRNDKTGSSGLLGFDLLDDNAIFERLDGHRHG